MVKYKRLSSFIILIIAVFMAINLTVFSQGRFVARVVVVSNDVELMRDDTMEWVTLGMESIVGVGDRLRTGQSGILRVETLEGATNLEVEPNSEILVNQLESADGEQTVSLTLAEGAMSGRLSSGDGMTVFEITLPGMTFYTRASTINAWVTDDEFANVIVDSGTIYVAKQDDSLLEVVAGRGLSASQVGALGRVLPTQSRAELTTLRRGIPVAFSVNSDIQMNVRRGPSLNAELLGTILPTDIAKVYATDDTQTWYRIDYDNGFAWVSAATIETSIASTEQLARFPETYIEPTASQTEEELVVEATPEPNAAYRPAVLDYLNGDEMELLAELNAWRTSIGLSGFMPNETLSEMAHDQANHLASLDALPNNYHVDAQGRDEDARGLDPKYSWTFYLTQERIALGENAWIGANMDAAFNFWRSSNIHRTTVENPGYREVGVAVVPSRFGRIYLTVFGSRPNIFPVLYDTTNNQLIMANEQYRYADPGEWITNIERFQIIESGFATLEDDQWQAFTSRIDLPEQTQFAVTFEGQGKQVAMPVDLRENILWLPDNLPADNGTLAAVEAQNQDASSSAPSLPTIPPVDGSALATPTMAATPIVQSEATAVPQNQQRQVFTFPTNTPVGN